MTIVRRHLRKKPTAASTIHVEVGTIAMRRYQKIAERLGTTVEAIATEAITERFEVLRNG